MSQRKEILSKIAEECVDEISKKGLNPFNDGTDLQTGVTNLKVLALVASKTNKIGGITRKELVETVSFHFGRNPQSVQGTLCSARNFDKFRVADDKVFGVFVPEL